MAKAILEFDLTNQADEINLPRMIRWNDFRNGCNAAVNIMEKAIADSPHAIELRSLYDSYVKYLHDYDLYNQLTISLKDDDEC